MKTDAERRQLTVLFCDLVNSTQLSAALDPEDMRHVLDRFLATCAEAIARFGGVVGNYLGDGVLAYFGYPTAHEDDAERAVHAGLALIANVGRLNAHPGITLQTRIGIATGLVVAGDIVANPERAVVGETLNLAARLHELAAPDGVVVADSTAKLLGRSFRLQPAPPAPLKGFAEPVPHWLVTGQGEQRTRFAARRPESLPLIGRDDDLAAMRARARAAWAGPGAATLLRGEAGIGKSRLAAAFAADPGLDPGAPKRLVVTYQCSPYHVESVLYPFRAEFMLTNRLTPRDPPANHFAAVRRALEITRPRDPDALALIATLLAIPPAGLYPALLLSPAEQRRRWLAIIIDMLASVAAQRPLLILFEDAHWADATSLELLGAMIDKLSDIPAYIIITARPEFAAPWQTSPLVETRDLGHLDQPSILALVRRVCAERRLDEQTERDIAARADGIPLFAEELARSLMDAGEAAARTGHAPEIPATLKDSLTARLDRLGPAKDIAQMGAAIGRAFARDLLAAIAGRDDAALDDTLAELEAADLISASGEGANRAYKFKHALIRDAAYESLLKSRRPTLHLAIASVLADQFPAIAESEPEIVARHFDQARSPHAAASWWYKAGELAVRRAGYAEAIEHFGRAITLADNITNGSDLDLLRLRLQLAYGQALMTLNGYTGPGTIAAFERAREISAGVADPNLRHATMHGLWLGHYITANVPGMRAMTEALLADTANHPGSTGALFAQTDSGMLAWVQGEFREAQAIFEANWAACPPEPDLQAALTFGMEIGVNALTFLALCKWPLGDLEGAERTFDLALERAQSSGFPPAVPYVQLFRSYLDYTNGDFSAMRTRAASVLGQVSAQGLEFYRAWAQIIHGFARCRTGEPDGLAEIIAARRYFEDTGALATRILLGAWYADLIAESEPEQSLALIAQDKQIIAQTQEHWGEAPLLITEADILCRLNDPAAAAAAYKAAITVARRQSAATFERQASRALARLETEAQ